MSKQKIGERKSKFKSAYYVRVFRLAQQGLKNKAIATALGVSLPTFKSWIRKYPALRESLVDARTVPNGEDSPNTLNAFVYNRLPAKLQPVWDAMCEAEEEPNGEKRLELLTRNQGKTAMQHLWLHALVSSNFNKNEACRRTNLPRSTVNEWAKNDPDFHALCDEILIMKKDFVEGCLMNLVAGGDTTATIFVAKSLLKKEGYDPKTVIQVEGDVTHKHFDMLNILKRMSLKAQKEWLAAMNGKGDDEPEVNPPAVKQLNPPKPVQRTVEDDIIVDDEEED